MTGLENIIKRFQGADRDTRLELLLDFANRLPPLPEKYREAVAQGVNRVHECQTPVYLFMEPVNGSVEIHADVPREAPTVRGFLSLLIKGLKGATPEEVIAMPGDLLDRLQLSELLGMTRMQGLSAVVQRLKRMALQVNESKRK
jgi:cysteine desulfuration protein SufE